MTRFSVLLREGEHSLVFGDRGVGKTTLINRVAIQYANLRKSLIKSHSCTLNDNLQDILKCLLNEVGINTDEIARQEIIQRKGNTKLSVGFASAGVDSQKQESISLKTDVNSSSLNDVVNKIGDLNAVFIIDEFDNL